jgi:hypothetical protein
MGVLVLINAFAQFLGEVAKFQSWQTLLHLRDRTAAGRTTARASSRCCASPCCWT